MDSEIMGSKDRQSQRPDNQSDLIASLFHLSVVAFFQSLL